MRGGRKGFTNYEELLEFILEPGRGMTTPLGIINTLQAGNKLYSGLRAALLASPLTKGNYSDIFPTSPMNVPTSIPTSEFTKLVAMSTANALVRPQLRPSSYRTGALAQCLNGGGLGRRAHIATRKLGADSSFYGSNSSRIGVASDRSYNNTSM